MMNKIPEYNSPLMDEIYKNIPQTTFNLAAEKMVKEIIKKKVRLQKQVNRKAS